MLAAAGPSKSTPPELLVLLPKTVKIQKAVPEVPRRIILKRRESNDAKKCSIVDTILWIPVGFALFMDYFLTSRIL